MKLTTRKERINFDVASDLTARHRICAAFLGYKERVKSKLIRDVKSSTTMKTRSQTSSTTQKSMIWRWEQDALDSADPVTALKAAEKKIAAASYETSNTQKSMLWRWAQDAEDFIQPAPPALVRTEAFIECRQCRFKNTKYEDNCVKCDTQLSTRPSAHKYL